MRRCRPLLAIRSRFTATSNEHRNKGNKQATSRIRHRVDSNCRRRDVYIDLTQLVIERNECVTSNERPWTSPSYIVRS